MFRIRVLGAITLMLLFVAPSLSIEILESSESDPAFDPEQVAACFEVFNGFDPETVSVAFDRVYRLRVAAI